MSKTTVKVKDVMQTDLHMIGGLASVRDAIVEMRAHGISALIIERRHEEDEYGFISVDQIAKRVIAPNGSIDRTSVYEIMEKPTLTLNPHMALKYAVRLLARLDYKRALVVDEEGAKGLITLRDMVHSIALDTGWKPGVAEWLLLASKAETTGVFKYPLLISYNTQRELIENLKLRL